MTLVKKATVLTTRVVLGCKKFFTKKEEGAALVEYGMLVGLIAVVCIAAVGLLGQDISRLFTKIANTLSTVGT